MKPRKSLAVIAVLLASFVSAWAQSGTRTKLAAMPSTPAPPPHSPEIARILSQVSPANIQATINKLVSFGTRLTISTNVPPESGRGVLAAREWIRSQFERYSKDCGGCLEVNVYTFTEPPGPRIPQPVEIGDVYAVLRGTDPENAKRIILLSGHYDTIVVSAMTDPKVDAPGANDDGSGTSLVLEAARVMSKMKFPATIVFLTVAGEEQGLNGSRGFAKMAKSESWNIEAMLNNDIVGGDKNPGQDPQTVRIFSEGIPSPALDDRAAVNEIRMTGLENDSPSRQLARYIGAVSGVYKRDGAATAHLVWRQDRFLRGGDHTSFNQQGFTAVRFTEWHENYNHQHQAVRTENGIEYGDLPKFVDFDYVARVTRLNVATAASLALAPAPPTQVRVETKQLENDTTLNWQPSPGGLAAGYEVVWRDTTAPYWEHVQSVGTATNAKLAESKDNVIFGVRAVGKDGQRSLVVIPTRETRPAAAK